MSALDDAELKSDLSKVPAVTLGFWIIKILATTLGETGGDAVTMSWLGETTASAGSQGFNGYVVGTAIFGSMLAVLVWLQIAAKRFHPALYWSTIIASTMAGTTLADFSTRSLGIGYPGGSLLLFALLLTSLLIWKAKLGSIAVGTVHEPKAELFYWLSITFSQTLGTALGDWIADGPLGYLGSAAIFSSLLALVALAYWRTTINRATLFWAAFILTRPLGAVIGDFIDKPVSQGGLELSRLGASLTLTAAIVALLLALPKRAAPKE